MHLRESNEFVSVKKVGFGMSLGARESAINRAEGLRQSKILASEAMRIEQVNKAKGREDYP